MTLKAKTRVSSKGQIVLPKEIRDADDLKPGQELEIERLEPGIYKLKRLKRPNEGLVDLLLACPEKGWFRRFDFGTTDDLFADKDILAIAGAEKPRPKAKRRRR